MGKPYIFTRKGEAVMDPVLVMTTALMESSSIVGGPAAVPSITFLAHATPSAGVAAPAGMGAVTVTTE